MSEWISEQVVSIMESMGYLGIGLLMFLENLFPPIPSELIMPLAGFTVSRGDMVFVYAVLAGVIGTMLGAIPWYYMGLLVGEQRLQAWADRYGKWLGISGQDIQKTKIWFERHGTKAVLVGRLVPGVRTLISIPAGMSEMAIVPFLIYSTLGTLAWVLLLTSAGYFLGQNYKLVEVWLGPVSKYVLITLVAGFITWVLLKQIFKSSQE